MRYLFTFSAVIAVATLLITCKNSQPKEEQIARQYCSRCHSFPEPALLPKKIWEEGVLPQMAINMGVKKIDLYSGVLIDDLPAIYEALPEKPMVTNEEWEAIRTYYAKNAPDSLTYPAQLSVKEQKQFDVNAVSLPIATNGAVTLVQADTGRDHFYVGTRDARLFQLDASFRLQDSVVLKSPPSQVRIEAGELPLVLTMGIMNPNDQELGEVLQLNPADQSTTLMIKSLKRPVFIEKADLNNDQWPDYVACEFGNYTGAISIYENNAGKGFRKRTLHALPGARKVIVRDIDGNGKLDIIALMTQGDESIVLFSNMGNFDFKMTTLLRFPPMYGSSYFDIADFNNDGKFDILYTNGDNADDSQILKPYHTVSIYLNSGKNEFKQDWSYRMDGASQAVARDFDGDGDLDIAAIAYFPDYAYPEKSFIYFENTGKDFTAQTTPLSTSGRWIVMETADIDHDGDDDIVLGALDFPTTVPDALQQRWATENNSLLVLRNRKIQSVKR